MNQSNTYLTLIFVLSVFLSWTSLGWIDPLTDKIREGNQRYHDGKYNEALDKYVNAQLESPNTPHIDFNIADTQYKRGKYDEAVQSYEKVMKSGDAEMRAKSSFNMGNTLYRQGKKDDAQESYKKTIDLIDELESKGIRDLDTLKNDARYNYEYIEKKKKEEEQKQQQQNKQQKDQQEKENKDSRKNEEQPDKDKDKKKDKEESQQNQQQPKPEDTPEKSKEKKEESPRHSEKEKQQEQPQEQKLQQPSGQKQMSKEEAERLLDALNQSEKEARAIEREKRQTRHGSVEKDW